MLQNHRSIVCRNFSIPVHITQRVFRLLAVLERCDLLERLVGRADVDVVCTLRQGLGLEGECHLASLHARLVDVLDVAFCGDGAVAREEQDEGILAGQAGAVQLEHVRACVEAAVLRAVRHGQRAGHIIDAEDFRVFRKRGCGEHREPSRYRMAL